MLLIPDIGVFLAMVFQAVCSGVIVTAVYQAICDRFVVVVVFLTMCRCYGCTDLSGYM